MYYCNGVKGFINYVLSNPKKNISVSCLRCSCKRCKKTNSRSNVVMMHLL